VNIRGPPKARNLIMPAATVVVAVAVDQDKGAGAAIVLVGIEKPPADAVERFAYSDLIYCQRARGKLFERIDVELMLDEG